MALLALALLGGGAWYLVHRSRHLGPCHCLQSGAPDTTLRPLARQAPAA